LVDLIDGRQALLPAVFPLRIEHTVSRDRQETACKRSAPAVELVRIVPQTEEDVLDNLLRLVLAKHMGCQDINRAHLSAVQLLKGNHIVRADARCQFLVVRFEPRQLLTMGTRIFYTRFAIAHVKDCTPGLIRQQKLCPGPSTAKEGKGRGTNWRRRSKKDNTAS